MESIPGFDLVKQQRKEIEALKRGGVGTW